MDFTALQENASRLGMRIQETFSEHTRDLTLVRGAGYLDGAEDTRSIRKQLDSSSDRDKLDAMKRLVALISKGRNVSEYFAQVVKNVASHNLEVRKLVYIYLLRYAEAEPDLALLSINTFQRDLADGSPLIRAMALRVLSGIRVPMIGSLVVLAIKKCAADVSPYVRKAAALAIPKCFELDTTHQPALISIIGTLLGDRSPLSIGCVAVAFEAVCPTRLDLLHRQYRRLCRVLVDVDEWGQVDIMNLLLRYARTMLPRPVLTADGEEVDQDVKLLLSSCEPLFQSQNPAVVMAATRVFFYAGTPSYQVKMVQPLIRLLAMSKEIERVTITHILLLSESLSYLFAPHHIRFIVRSTDARPVKLDKIRLLLNIVDTDNNQAILREFIDYADDTDDEVVFLAIRAVGRCAALVSECSHQCLNALTGMIRSRQDAVVSGAVLVLKQLVQTQLGTGVVLGQRSPLDIVAQLARKVDNIRHAQARACVLWLVGQYGTQDGETVAEWAPDVLRKAAKSFATEDSLVKLQIVTLAAKLFVVQPEDRILGLLAGYVFSLARYDANYDVRDRGRMMSAMLAGVMPASIMSDGEKPERAGVVLRREQVRMVIFQGKSGVVEDDPSPFERATMLGSLGVITGKPAADSVLPDWLEQGVESIIRDSEDDRPTPVVPLALSSAQVRSTKGATPVVLTPTSSSPATTSATRAPYTDLDAFYADEESEEGEDQEEEEEEGSEEESDEGESEDGSEDGSAPKGSESEEESEDDAASEKSATRDFYAGT
ncbi:adaptin N terminal region-domain-containing protein [Schizophyllum amplum]|uniref:AP complex subunit beta n=1 Tax=Schizophyllum amplum TaxID=97359 RepID=A0A550CJI3_9AGAR|nr:adaptin N terminal region-domain-containing protein [Auriculariopsis ampla]